MAPQPDFFAKPVKAIIYMRSATRKGAHEEGSIPDQRLQLRNYCDTQGWDIIGEYYDDMMGGHEERPDFLKMFEDIENGDARPDVILIQSVERFFRDAAKFEFYHNKLLDLGVELVSVTQDLSVYSEGGLARRLVQVFDKYRSQ